MKIRPLTLYLFLAISMFAQMDQRFVLADPIELNYANFFSPIHTQAKLGASWAEEVERRTNGRVKINYLPDETLVKAHKTYHAIVDGAADIGMSVFAYSRGVFPAMEAIDLPMGYPNGRVATMITNDFYKRFRPKELGDLKVLYLHAHGPGLLHSRRFINKLNLVRGLKIRATGNSAKVAEALGGGLGGLKGHRSVGGCRASIYNPTPLAAVEELVAFMKDFEAKNG